MNFFFFGLFICLFFLFTTPTPQCGVESQPCLAAHTGAACWGGQTVALHPPQEANCLLIETQHPLVHVWFCSEVILATPWENVASIGLYVCLFVMVIKNWASSLQVSVANNSDCWRKPDVVRVHASMCAGVCVCGEVVWGEGGGVEQCYLCVYVQDRFNVVAISQTELPGVATVRLWRLA